MPSNPYALNFNSTSAVTIPSSTSLNISTDMCVMMQFKITSLSDQYFFTYGLGTGWGLRVGFVSGKLYGDVTTLNSTPTTTAVAPATNTISINQYYRVALAYKDNQYIKLYLNGVEIASASTSGKTTIRHSGNSYIGANAASGTPANIMSGNLDEVSIWNYCPTDTDIKWYDGKSLNGNESGLVAYYKCDAGSGTTLIDSTTNGNNGTFSTGVSFTTDTPIVYYKKLLIQDGTNILSVSGTSASPVLTVAGNAPVTQAMFDTNGVSDINLINNATISKTSSSNPKLLLWADASSSNYVPYETITQIPFGRTIFQNTDYNLASYQSVKSASLTSTLSGSGVIKVIVSVDKGTTWYTWNSVSGSWAVVDTTVVANVKSNGMSPSTLSARTQTDWGNLIGSSSTIRFAYYLEQTTSTDAASIDSLAVMVDMKGSWDMAVSNTDFKYGYPLNNDLRVTIYTSGDYKINYQG